MLLKNSLKCHFGDIFVLCGQVAVIARITSILVTIPSLTMSDLLSAEDHTILVLMVMVAGTSDEDKNQCLCIGKY
jgi:hypothetical protein